MCLACTPPPSTSDLWDKGKCPHAHFLKTQDHCTQASGAAVTPGFLDHPQSPGGALAFLELASLVTPGGNAMHWRIALAPKSIILRWDCRLPQTSQVSRCLTKGSRKSWGFALKILTDAQSSPWLPESVGKLCSGAAGEGCGAPLGAVPWHRTKTEP